MRWFARILAAACMLAAGMGAAQAPAAKLALVIGVGDYGRDAAELSKQGFLVPPTLANATAYAETVRDPVQTSGMHWVGEAGLLLDIIGAVFLTAGLVISKDRALELGVGKWAYSNDEENLQLLQVRDPLTQSRNAKVGLVFLVFGFIGQAIGAWPP